MAEDSKSPRRHRWLVLAVLVSAGGWIVRARRVGADPTATPQPLLTPAATSAPEPESELAVAEPPTSRPSPTPRPRRNANPARDHGPGSAAPRPDGSAPGPEYTIKGNPVSMLFHPPNSPYYRRTKAEVWFRTAGDARAAGFTEWTPKRRATDSPPA